MSLTSEQYEGILKFSHFINSDYTKFIPNVLYAFAEFCNYPLSVYTVFGNDDDSGVESIHGHNIYATGLQQYKQGVFHTDLFVQRVAHTKQGLSQKPVLTILDVATYDEFYNTDYGRYLQSINTPYQATMRSNRIETPIHVLNAFKTSEQGEFTLEERELLSLVGECFSEAVGLYKQFLNHQVYKAFLDVETQRNNQVIAILDANNRILFQNEAFLPMVSSMLGTKGIFGSIKALFGAFQAQSGVHPSELTQEACASLNHFVVRIIPRFIFDGEAVQRYLFLSVEHHMAPVAPPQADKEDRRQEYGLTSREIEVADLMIHGQNNAQIAAQLCVNITTVKYHIQNIYSKLGVNRRAAAIAKLLT